jgi:hypothetical protein
VLQTRMTFGQIDLIDPLIRSETERAVVSRIVSQRRNLRDRFAFLIFFRLRCGPRFAKRAKSTIGAAMARARRARKHRIAPSGRATVAPA